MPKSDYEQFIDDLLAKIERRDEEAIRNVIRLLKEARERIALDLMEARGWEAYRLTELRAAVERALRLFETRAFNYLGREQNQRYEQAVQDVDALLIKMGERTPIAEISPYQLMVVQAYSADLIHGLTTEAISRINSTLTLGILGEKTSFQVMKQITEIIGEEGLKAVGGIAFKAERIARTELSRVMSLASLARYKDAARVVPGLMKEWRSVLMPGRTRPHHWAAHGQRVLVNEPFIVKGEEMMCPHDPAGSPENVVNCMCRMVLWHPSWEISIRGEELPAGETVIIPQA